MDENLLWLLNWFHLHCNRKWEFHDEVDWDKHCDTERERDKAILITTFDNPGWGFVVRLEETELEHRTLHAIDDTHRSEHDWISILKRGGRYRAAGGPFNLPQLLQAFRDWAETGNDEVPCVPLDFEWTHLIDYPPAYQQSMDHIQDNMTWLITWFYSQCNQDWEHNNSINIYNYNGPNWCFEVCFESTPMENQPFEDISIQRSETDWLRCSTNREFTQPVFEGYGGPFNLPEIIQIFRQWAQSTYDLHPVDPHHFIL